MVRLAVTWIACAAAAVAAGPGFTWKQKDGRYTLYENNRPVLAYNQGVQSVPGVPQDRARCCYVHPIWSPGGVVITDDFPEDHYHHRGMFWAWTVVETATGKYDLWMLKGMKPRNVSVSAESDGQSTARLRASNQIDTFGGQTVLAEELLITIRAAQQGAREFDLDLKLAAVSGPVRVRGSQEKGKSYGGLSVRFAPRKETQLRTNRGALAKDDDLTRYEWAELEGEYAGGRALLRLTSHPDNPGHPPQWVLRKYGFIGASFPGRSASVDNYVLHPGKPLKLRYTVRVEDRASKLSAAPLP